MTQKIKSKFLIFTVSFLALLTLQGFVFTANVQAIIVSLACENGALQDLIWGEQESGTEVNNSKIVFKCTDGSLPIFLGVMGGSTGDVGYFDITCAFPSEGSTPPTPVFRTTNAGEPTYDCGNALVYYTDITSRTVADRSSEGGALDVCTNEQAADSDAGECVDSFSRCPNGEYGYVVNGECVEYDPSVETELKDNPIIHFLGDTLGFLTVGVGVILTLVVVIAGIRYSLARGNPQETAAAKDMIFKAAVSAFLYLFAFAIINWLIPGGLL